MFRVLKFHQKQHQHEISRLIFIVFFQIIFLEIIKPSRLFVTTVACKIIKPSQLFVDFCTFFSKFLVPPPKIEPVCKTSPLFVVRFYCTVKVYISFRKNKGQKTLHSLFTFFTSLTTSWQGVDSDGSDASGALRLLPKIERGLSFIRTDALRLP